MRSTMLLSASTKKARAAEPYAGPGTSNTIGLGDDFVISPGDDDGVDDVVPNLGDDFFIP